MHTYICSQTCISMVYLTLQGEPVSYGHNPIFLHFTVYYFKPHIRAYFYWNGLLGTILIFSKTSVWKYPKYGG